MKITTLFLGFVMIAVVILGLISAGMYISSLTKRSCESNYQCGPEGFCDENKRCQFPTTITKHQQHQETVYKHNITGGFVWLVIGLVAAILILKPRRVKSLAKEGKEKLKKIKHKKKK